MCGRTAVQLCCCVGLCGCNCVLAVSLRGFAEVFVWYVAVLKCSCIALWLCGCVAVLLCSCLATYLCGCVAVQLCSCVTVWQCSCVDVQLCS